LSHNDENHNKENILQNSFFESPRMVVFFSLFGWVVAGYAFFTLIIFSGSIGNYLFHTDNPADIHYVMFGLIALTLLARFAGGLFFGRLGDTHGRLHVMRIVLFSLTILMAISLFLPMPNNNMEFVPIFFIITRILIGFLTGGLWPTGGVYALEKIQHFHHTHRKPIKFRFKKIFPASNDRTKIKTLGWQSAWVQSGFQWAILIEESIKIFLIQNTTYVDSILGSDYSFSDPIFVSNWVFVSLIGICLGVIGTILAFFMNESSIWEKRMKKIDENYAESSVKTGETPYPLVIKNDAQDPKNHKKIVNLWLIMAGVMYLFYSTMAIIPGYFPRSDYIVEVCTADSLIPCNWIFGALTFIFISLAAHILPGQHLTKLWNDNVRGHHSSKWTDAHPEIKKAYDLDDKSAKSILNRLKYRWRIFWNPSFFYRVAMRMDIKFLPMLNKFTRYELDRKKFIGNSYENKDLLIILTHAYMALYPALILLVLFFVVFLMYGSTDLTTVMVDENKHYEDSLRFILYALSFLTVAFILFVVTSTWSIIPSTLSSMFPIARRNFWTSSIYTGGTIVGFAAPFVSIQIIQQYDHVWLLLPLIFGAISIIVGSRSLIMENLHRPGDNIIE